jgi:hypothetical protein
MENKPIDDPYKTVVAITQAVREATRVRKADHTQALRFILDLAEEEYPHITKYSGVEIVLRHIIKRCKKELGLES